MEITPVAATSFVVLNPLSSNDGFREGRVLQAKVMEMLSDKLARLAIDGQAVAIKTDKPLPVGTTLTLRVERQDGQLRLVSQGQGQGQGQGQPQGETVTARVLANAPQTTLLNLAGPMKIALAKIHAMTLEAALAQGNKTAPSGATLQAPMAARAQAEAAIARQQSPNAVPPGSGAQTQQTSAARLAETAIRQFTAENPQSQQTASQRALMEPLNIRHVTADGTPLAQAKTTQAPSAGANQMAGAARQSMAAMAEQLAAPSRQPVQDPLLSAKSAPATAGQTDGAAMRAAAPDAQTAAKLNAAAQPPPATAQPALHGEAAEARPRAAAEMIEGAQRSTSDMLNAQPRAERFTTWTVELPLFIAGSNTPMRLDIVRDDEPAPQPGGEKRAPAWMVRFDSDTASIGRIRAAISLIDGHIGVHLWAERPDTANWFQQNTPQLRNALIASNLALDNVTVAQIGASDEGVL